MLNPYPVQVTGVMAAMDNWALTTKHADHSKVLPMRTLSTRDIKTSVPSDNDSQQPILIFRSSH